MCAFTPRPRHNSRRLVVGSWHLVMWQAYHVIAVRGRAGRPRPWVLLTTTEYTLRNAVPEIPSTPGRRQPTGLLVRYPLDAHL